MPIKKYLQVKRNIVQTNLEKFLEQQQQETVAFKIDAVNFLQNFVASGKLYRGCLVFLGYDLFAQKDSATFKSDDSFFQALIKTAMAVELTQSAFLLHDDFMDQDDLRRGQPTFHQVVMSEPVVCELAGARHLGYSQAINLGDTLLFWAGNLISQAAGISQTQQLSEFYAGEMVKTCWGQMEDVYLSQANQATSQAGIINMITLKSAHYSVINPLVLGAILGKADEPQRQLLENFALNLGIIFQLKDDELGLFGDEQQLGKPVGSDIKENKQTLFRNFLFKAVNQTEKKELDQIFGNKELTHTQIKFVQQLLDQYQIRQQVSKLVIKYETRANQSLELLTVNSRSKELLSTLMALMSRRKK